MSRNLSIGAAIICAALCLATSPASRGETSDFFTKFQMQNAPDWSGWYGGFNVGGSWNHFDAGKQPTDVNLTDQFYDIGVAPGGNVEVFTTFHTPGHDDTQGVTVGGFQTGFNLQFGHFLIGAEGMFIGNGSNTSTNYHEFQTNELFNGGMSTDAFIGPITAETDFYSRRTFETIWNGFVGGKLGFALNRLLFYGAGGVAFSDIHIHTMETADTSFFQGCTGDCTDRLNQLQGRFIGEIISRKKGGEGEVLTGWYGGVGTDFALTNIVSIGLEYRHVDWGDKTGHFTVAPNNGPVFPSDQNVGLDGDQVLLKFNIMLSHFNPFQ